jgi:hypothetical protein
MHDPPCWPASSTHATLWYGLAATPHTTEVTVAVTKLAPSTCTTCGGDNVKPHGDGGQGSACAAVAPMTPAIARVNVADIAMTSRIISGW